MVRVRRVRVITPMTIDALRWQPGKLVVHVARRTRDGLMRSGQRETRRGMTERRRRPGGCRMTRNTIVIKRPCGVVWTDGRFKIALMALVAARVGELIISVHVTRLTINCRVFTG